ncbi:MAG TPA: hypothetical protein VK661_00895 [Planctomycetota bacterium]|nr:hypothetical protein [Planctomycetota bacterium]
MRLGIVGIALVVSCAAAPPPQAVNDGEALYRKMEAALAAAKKLEVTFESTAEGPGSAKVSGTFKVEAGNKVEMNVQGLVGVKKYTLELSCDGAKMNLKRTETPPPPVPLGPQPELPAPATLGTNVAAALARGGAWFAQEFADGEYRAVADPYFEERQTAKAENRPMKEIPAVAPRDATTLHTMANFRLGKSEGGATPVTYDLTAVGEKVALVTTVTVWVDAKTSLPVKREGALFAKTQEGKAGGPPLSSWKEQYKTKIE